MFSGCTNLTSLPKHLLPNVNLLNGCYEYMFRNCTGITSIHENFLPAEYLCDYCYQGMFKNTSIVELNDKIFGTIIGYSSCYEMFSDCKELTTIGEDLLSNVSIIYGYGLYRTFQNCIKLKNIPNKLFSDNATFEYSGNNTYGSHCSAMFSNTGIEEIPETFLNVHELKNNSYSSMFSNCQYLTTLHSN